MSDALISVIIPIFNTAPNLLDRCISSICKQNYRKVEVVIVDDGSKIELSNLYRKTIGKYCDINILFFYQQNAGVSVARNKGIELASGDYIAFVDADDVIADSFLCEAMDFADGKFDLVMGSMMYVDSVSNECEEERIVKEPIQLLGDDIIQLQLALVNGKSTIDYKSNRLFGSPCARLYRADICRKVKFAEGVTNLEDQLFNREFFRHISSAYLVPNIWYIYYQYTNSAMHYNKTADSFYNKMLPFWNEWHKLNLSENMNLKSATYDYTIALFNSAVENMIPSKKYRDSKRIISRIMQVDLFKDLRKEVCVNELNSIKHKATFLFIIFKFYFLIYFSTRFK